MIEIIEDKQIYTAACRDNNVSLNQSWLWAETRTNFKAIRLLQGGFPITVYIRSALGGLIKFAYIPRCFNETYLNSPENITRLTEFLKSYEISHLIIEPNIPQNNSIIKLLQSNNFKLSGKTIQPNQTQVIGLELSDEDLLSGMKSKTRQYIRKTARQGISVELNNEKSGFEEFYKVMGSIVENKDYVMHDKSYFENIYNNYKDSSSLSILLAKKGDELHGAYMTIKSSNTMYELYGGVNSLGAKSRASYLLKWQSILNAKEQGCELYDQWGVANVNEKGEFDESDSMYKISKYKASFGGQTVEFMPQMTYVYEGLKYSLFKAAMSSHKAIIKIKGKL